MSTLYQWPLSSEHVIHGSIENGGVVIIEDTLGAREYVGPQEMRSLPAYREHVRSQVSVILQPLPASRAQTQENKFDPAPCPSVPVTLNLRMGFAEALAACSQAVQRGVTSRQRICTTVDWS